nr:hypothetical protein [Polymorphobacter multimanifer]
MMPFSPIAAWLAVMLPPTLRRVSFRLLRLATAANTRSPFTSPDATSAAPVSTVPSPIAIRIKLVGVNCTLASCATTRPTSPPADSCAGLSPPAITMRGATSRTTPSALMLAPEPPPESSRISARASAFPPSVRAPRKFTAFAVPKFANSASVTASVEATKLDMFVTELSGPNKTPLGLTSQILPLLPAEAVGSPRNMPSITDCGTLLPSPTTRLRIANGMFAMGNPLRNSTVAAPFSSRPMEKLSQLMIAFGLCTFMVSWLMSGIASGRLMTPSGGGVNAPGAPTL